MLQAFNSKSVRLNVRFATEPPIYDFKSWSRYDDAATGPAKKVGFPTISESRQLRHSFRKDVIHPASDEEG